MSAEGQAGTQDDQLNEIAVLIARAMLTHYPTRGMKVAMGETCECRYWTGNENPSRRVGLAGPDQLNWHRAKVAAHVLLDLGRVESDRTRFIAEAIAQHYPTRGMRTSGPDVECECGYSTSDENPPQNSIKGPGLGGRDRLNWHRANVAAEALIGAWLIIS